MSQSYEELDKELVSAIKNLSSVVNEYTQKFVSAAPLGNGPIPTFAYREIQEVTDRHRAAEERYLTASQNMQKFRNDKQP